MPSVWPPLNSLKAFEAAARHASFRKAANELNVSPAAISHQIKKPGGLSGRAALPPGAPDDQAIDAGQAALPLLRDGFGPAGRGGAADARGGRPAAGAAHLGAPSLAAKWLCRG